MIQHQQIPQRKPSASLGGAVPGRQPCRTDAEQPRQRPGGLQGNGRVIFKRPQDDDRLARVSAVQAVARTLAQPIARENQQRPRQPHQRPNRINDNVSVVKMVINHRTEARHLRTCQGQDISKAQQLQRQTQPDCTQRRAHRPGGFWLGPQRRQIGRGKFVELLLLRWFSELPPEAQRAQQSARRQQKQRERLVPIDKSREPQQQGNDSAGQQQPHLEVTREARPLGQPVTLAQNRGEKRPGRLELRGLQAKAQALLFFADDGKSVRAAAGSGRRNDTFLPQFGDVREKNALRAEQKFLQRSFTLRAAHLLRDDRREQIALAANQVFFVNRHHVMPQPGPVNPNNREWRQAIVPARRGRIHARPWQGENRLAIGAFGARAAAIGRHRNPLPALRAGHLNFIAVRQHSQWYRWRGRTHTSIKTH